MIVRSIERHEVASLFDHVPQMLNDGQTHLDWCFVVQDADRIIGRIAYWVLSLIPYEPKPMRKIMQCTMFLNRQALSRSLSASIAINVA